MNTEEEIIKKRLEETREKMKETMEIYDNINRRNRRTIILSFIAIALSTASILIKVFMRL